MDNWREQILKEFTPQVSRLTLVADPDALLTEEGIIQGLRERGFDLITFDNPIAFRFAYESRYRSLWDRGELTELVVVLRAEMQDLGTLPFDLLQAGRKLSFNLGDLFPNLSYPVIEMLDRADLDALCRAQLQYNPDKLGDNATKDFVLLHVFDIAPKLIRRSPDLLKVLLRRHFRNQRIPSILDERFIQVVRSTSSEFENWPLEEIVSDRNIFFAFLQERWPVFLNRVVAKNYEEISDEKHPYNLKYDGPFNLPFDHDDVRIYIDNLFFEGLLHPVSHPHADKLNKTWVSSGIKLDPEGDRLRRLEGLLKAVDSSVPPPEARHQDWLTFAQRWAELTVLFTEVGKSSSIERSQHMGDIQQKVERTFFAWLLQRFAGLHNQPPVPPVMVHHIPRAMSRQIEKSKHEKIALIVIDGLSVDQWVVLREALSEQRPGLQFRESAVLGWIPTITSVSRQALFAGKLPLYFPANINTTAKESSLWAQFWLDKGLSRTQVTYARGLGDGSVDELKDLLEHPQVCVAGLVVDKVDKIMHGMELGTAGMHNQVHQWAIQGYMNKLINLLHDLSFSIWITSDHGNIEAEGCGRPTEGAVADLKGERVRIYSDHALRSKVKEKFLEAIEWPSIGLPENYLPLLAQGRSAFIQEGKRTVSHGGVSLEEVVVPLIQIEADTDDESTQKQE
ncbi:MAG: BREX-3 system phosphatase PglZ [Syntrophaceae bacterium]|nr:BREX-3 system phosphatase PglZ [Syntrophaceae bacterium]